MSCVADALDYRLRPTLPHATKSVSSLAANYPRNRRMRVGLRHGEVVGAVGRRNVAEQPGALCKVNSGGARGDLLLA